MSTVIRRLGNVALWLILAAVATLAVVMVLIPRILGWVPLTILTGSMEPAIPTGSQVVVEPVAGEADAARLQLGDVVTFMPHPDDTTLVTHRIVTRHINPDGTVSFTTQGDANGAADPWTVTATQLRGVVRYDVPYAGYLASALTGEQKETGVRVAAAALFAYAAIEIIGALLTGRRGVAAVAAVETETAREGRQLAGAA